MRDRTGAGVADALLVAFNNRGAARARPEARSEGDGSYTLPGLEAGAYHILASAPGFVRKTLTTEAGATGADILLDAGGAISGMVVDEGGKPVDAFRVVARSKAGSAWDAEELEKDVVSDDGRFTVEDVGAGTHVVEISASQYSSGAVSDVRVSAGSVTDVGRVRLGRGGTVRGTVTSTRGKPDRRGDGECQGAGHPRLRREGNPDRRPGRVRGPRPTHRQGRPHGRASELRGGLRSGGRRGSREAYRGDKDLPRGRRASRGNRAQAGRWPDRRGRCSDQVRPSRGPRHPLALGHDARGRGWNVHCRSRARRARGRGVDGGLPGPLPERAESRDRRARGRDHARRVRVPRDPGLRPRHTRRRTGLRAAARYASGRRRPDVLRWRGHGRSHRRTHRAAARHGDDGRRRDLCLARGCAGTLPPVHEDDQRRGLPGHEAGRRPRCRHVHRRPRCGWCCGDWDRCREGR